MTFTAPVKGRDPLIVGWAVAVMQGVNHEAGDANYIHRVSSHYDAENMLEVVTFHRTSRFGKEVCVGVALEPGRDPVLSVPLYVPKVKYQFEQYDRVPHAEPLDGPEDWLRF